MKHPIRIECAYPPANRYRQPDFLAVETRGRRVHVTRYAPDGCPRARAPILDFPENRHALAVELANLLAGSKQ